MNNTAKNIIRIAGVVVGVAAAAWALRDKVLPSPEIHDEPPPRFRGGSSAADGSGTDLTEAKGIGPATATKLNNAGVSTLTDLAEADADTLAEATGSSPATTAKWIHAAADVV